MGHENLTFLHQEIKKLLRKIEGKKTGGGKEREECESYDSEELDYGVWRE